MSCSRFISLGYAAWIVAVLIFPPKVTNAGNVEVTIESGRAVIENGFLRWEMTVAENRFRTTSFVNRRTGEILPVRGEDFVLELDDGTNLRSSGCRVDSVFEEPSGTNGKKIVIELSRGNIRLRVLTIIRADQWWAERYLEGVAGLSGLKAVILAKWRCRGVRGWSGPGKIAGNLGLASGYGQPVYAGDIFFGITHPGAENFATSSGISCRIPTYTTSGENPLSHTPPLVVGAAEAGGTRRAFLGYIDATRPVPAHMVFLVNDWYWKDKNRPIEAMKALVRVKQQSGVPIDSFTLDDGWDFDWDNEAGIWGRLNRKRFPGGWAALQNAGRPANIGVSLWFGPIGGYGYRKRRVAFGRKMGYEINGDKLCLAGSRYRRHVIESFSQWASRGMDYIKVDGFWPNCRHADHGHPVGTGGTIAQMDALMEVFAAWRKARPGLVIGYTSGSNPSPFWLQHADFVWRGGADDSHAGVGEPFDRHNTFLDACLQPHRATEMPISAFVTFDIVQQRIAGNSAEGFERGIWWLAARTSLHHDWYIQASDLTIEQWKSLARVCRWAMKHQKTFRWSRMVGGDPRRGEIYGFSAFDGRTGTLALRNPSDRTAALQSSLDELVDLPAAARSRSFRLRSVFGETKSLEGVRSANEPMRIELPALAIAVVELEPSGARSP